MTHILRPLKHGYPLLLQVVGTKLMNLLIDWREFYAVLAIFQPCNGGQNTKLMKQTPVNEIGRIYVMD